MMMDLRPKEKAGFSLIEVMIVTALLAVLVMGVMTFFSTQKKNASVNSQIVDVQQSTRLIGALLERDFRHAGLMVPESAALCAIDRLNAPDTVFMSDSDAINSVDEKRNDLAGRVQGGAINISAGSQVLSVDSVVLEFSSPDPAYDTDSDGIADSDFRVGAGVIVTDASNPGRGTACGQVDAVSLATQEITITILTGILAALPVGSNPVDLVAVPANIYEINNATQLLRNGIVVADDVEDLQLAIFLDDNDNRSIDPGEYRGDGVGADFDPTAEDVSNAREVRANLLVRTRLEDPDNPGGRYQSSENRSAAPLGDGYRRRIHSSTVMLRNLGSRIP
ncbi:MAG: prepilin-type N-terminal cleavage/methylation domain-containing protein, partial [Myxococcota bacterium]|nr:prepilin-type N-terminal cleavage/methylation domain-containing protein [Myxococcota bacterium]